MKKLIIYTLSALALAAGCTERIPSPAGEGARTLPLNVSFTLGTKTASGITPVVNTIRLVIFDGNGQCVYNQLADSGDWTSTDGSDAVTIEFNDPITMITSTTSHDYELFAVLNEGGYTLAGTTSTLSSLFAEIVEGTRCELVFKSYFNGNIGYEAIAATGTEPAFIMGGSKSITVPEGSSQEPYIVEFDVMSRSLAQVTVTGISSTNASLDEAGIQIEEISLVNVPSSFAWGTAAGSLGNNPVSIDIAASGSDGFIARTTDGTSVSVTYSNISKTASTEDRMYLISTGDGPNAVTTVSFSDISSATQYNDANNAKNAAKKLSASAVVSTIESYFETKTGAIYADEGEPVMTGIGNWSIDLGASYYIPENIATEMSTATAIKVRASLSEPGLSGGIQSRESEIAFIMNGCRINGTSVSSSTKAEDLANLLSTEKQSNNKFVGYFSPISYSATASSYTANNVWKSTGHVYDFLIPVSSDFKLVRGTRYTISLKVDANTYSTLSTKAGAETAPFGISAIVETEKMNGYED